MIYDHPAIGKKKKGRGPRTKKQLRVKRAELERERQTMNKIATSNGYGHSIDRLFKKDG